MIQRRVTVFCKLAIFWVVIGFGQPRTQISSRHQSYLRKLGTERDSVRPGKNGRKVPDQRKKVLDNFSTIKEIFRTYEINTCRPIVCWPLYLIATKCGGRFFSHKHWQELIYSLDLFRYTNLKKSFFWALQGTSLLLLFTVCRLV